MLIQVACLCFIAVPKTKPSVLIQIVRVPVSAMLIQFACLCFIAVPKTKPSVLIQIVCVPVSAPSSEHIRLNVQQRVVTGNAVETDTDRDSLASL